MSNNVRRSVALAAGVVGVFGLALTTLATPASASPAMSTNASRPAAPYDDVLDGPWDPADGGWFYCNEEVLSYYHVAPNAGCVEVFRRNHYGIWLISDAGSIGT